MTKLRKTVYLGMAIMLASAPLLACTVPGLTMSEEEQECCQHMADMCGDTQMESSHSCCTKTPTVIGSSLQPTVKFSCASPVAVTAIAPQLSLSQMVSSSASFRICTEQLSNSPPGHTSVLRI